MGKKSATYSAESARHAQHKHLFGSGGKSDFILNMTPEGAQKMCGIYSMIAMLLLALSSVPYYISKAVGTNSDYLMLRTDDNETLAFLIMTLLVAMGFLGALMFMIACVKKEIVIKNNKSLWLFAAILVFATVSTLAAEDKGTAFFGYLDRAEGLLTLIGYIGFFTMGMSITSEKYRALAANTIVGIGTANAVLGILQSIPALSKWIPSYYNYLFIDYKSNLDVAEYFNAYAGYDASYAADGLCCSPFALGALLTVAAAFALNNACYGQGRVKRLLNVAAVGIMSAAAILTQTFPAMLGIACVLLTMLVITLAKAASEKKQESAQTYGKRPAAAVVLCGVIAAAVFGGVWATDNFRMRNEHIMYTDSFERLGIAYYAHSAHTDGIFPTLWYEGWLTFTDSAHNALLGVGPDNWATMYNGGDGMEIDRSYNEYLDIAITRGIFGAALQIAVVVLTLVKGIKILRSGKADKTAVGAFTAFLAYSVQAFFNISSPTSSPFFYLTVGLIWSYGARSRLTVAQDKADKADSKALEE
jgi:hypothetical protein